MVLVSMGAAGEAPAQSSVALFGVVDMAVNHVRGSGEGATRKTQLMSGADTTAKLGLRGTQDLGDGLTAGFWLALGLQGDTGAGFSSNSNNQANGRGAPDEMAFGRSTLSLAGAFGEVRLGRDYVPTAWNTLVYDPFGDFGGSLILPASLAGFASPTGLYASNGIGYLLPQGLGGFYGQATYAMGENDSNSVLPGTRVSNRRDGKHTSWRFGYASGGLDIAVAAGRTRYAGGDLRVKNLGLAYTFGPALADLTVMGELHADAIHPARGKGMVAGALLPIGAGEIKASYSRYRLDPGATGPRPVSSQISVGYVHNLSKRTALYVTAARITNRNGASQAFWGASTAPGHTSSGTACGMRHVF